MKKKSDNLKGGGIFDSHSRC